MSAASGAGGGRGIRSTGGAVKALAAGCVGNFFGAIAGRLLVALPWSFVVPAALLLPETRRLSLLRGADRSRPRAVRGHPGDGR